eukprot:Hpha_TRINITY_DN16459_c2_g1::TRINITY_DN16459_c2_g1_i4::g.162890::m.162890
MLRILPFVALLQAVEGVIHCKPDEASCWPTDAEIALFISELDPAAKRELRWYGEPYARPSPFPINSTGDQPLYGLGFDTLKPLYVRNGSDLEHQCFDPLGGDKVFDPEFCKAAVRNNPLEKWSPAFVVWPVTAQHVQAAVKFAVKHRLCVAVAGTGHDYNNRHSCPDGVFIRTSLMKDVDWDLTDSRGYGWAAGNVRFGPGIVFDEAHRSASKNGRIIASGWANTVGIIGWSIGGGHGPFVSSCGLGVDNVLSADIVLADGSLVTASATSHPDLYFAIRGGGGSTWGVITSITIRAHYIPVGGITISTTAWEGTDLEEFYEMNSAWVEWSKTLDSSWSGHAYFGTRGKDFWGRVKWYVMQTYVYGGSNTSTTFTTTIEVLKKQFKPVIDMSPTYATYADSIIGAGADPLLPTPWLPPSAASAGALGSALVSRENATKSLEVLPKIVQTCKNNGYCGRIEYYHITGNKGSPQPEMVSISPAFRTALYHILLGSPSQENTEEVWSLVGCDNAYFNESPYIVRNPAQTYWGDNAQRLQEIKTKYDNDNVFGCHNCVAAGAK